MSPKDRKTILVVDGNILMRQLLAEALSPGDRYNILMSETGAQALQQSNKFKGEIHLLLADFQPTGMTGIELATAVTIERPQLQVLLISGFPDGMLVLNEGWHFLPRPFIASQLRTLVDGLVLPHGKSRFSAVKPLQ